MKKNNFRITFFYNNNRAYFWYPTSHGGSGAGTAYRIANNGGVEDLPGLPGWAKADGRGAGYGMTTWALTGGLGGPVGFLAGTALGAAFSSLDHYAYS